jgi:hypothetical protein
VSVAVNFSPRSVVNTIGTFTSPGFFAVNTTSTTCRSLESWSVLHSMPEFASH